MNTNEEDFERCGRPTKSGAPCRNTRGLWDMPCTTHKTPEDEALGRRLRKAWKDGFEVGEDSGRSQLQREQESARLEEERRGRFRIVDGQGNQIVTCGAYAYVWRGKNTLRVGDRVVVPGNWFIKEPSTITVTEIGSDYQGQLSTILRKE